MFLFISQLLTLTAGTSTVFGTLINGYTEYSDHKYLAAGRVKLIIARRDLCHTSLNGVILCTEKAHARVTLNSFCVLLGVQFFE